MPWWIFISHSKSGSVPIFCTFNVMKYLWEFLFKWNLRFEVATVSLRILCKLLKILFRLLARHWTQSDCVLWGQFQNIDNVYPSRSVVYNNFSILEQWFFKLFSCDVILNAGLFSRIRAEEERTKNVIPWIFPLQLLRLPQNTSKNTLCRCLCSVPVFS